MSSGPPDYLVSICLAQEGDIEAEIAAICSLAKRCNAMLAFWEVIYVLNEKHHEALRACGPSLTNIKNLRVVLVRDGVNYYRRRAVSASEAIGDVVVLTCFREMEAADLFAFADDAVATNRIIIGRVRKCGLTKSALNSLIGAVSRYRVDMRDLKTIALPRDLLVAVLARPTASIDLRFEPKRGVAQYVRKEMSLSGSGQEAGLARRFELLSEIISTSAARFLTAFAAAAAVVCGLATSYALYAVVVFLSLKSVQPGWFSTAIAQSGSAAFISLGLGVIALGIAHIVDRLDGGIRHEVIDELGNISFYDRISDLNVEGAPTLRAIEEK